ncbi:hypothetical protein ACFX1Z_004564 [Malus domestica]
MQAALAAASRSSASPQHPAPYHHQRSQALSSGQAWPERYAKDHCSVAEPLTGLLYKAESAVSNELLHSHPRCSYS